MQTVFEDENLIIAIKPYGVLSSKDESREENVQAMLEEKLGIGLFPLHRLDRTVTGLIAFAKNAKAAADLSEMIAVRKGFSKEYLAVVAGRPDPDIGTYEDFLFKDSRTNKVYAVKGERKGAKKAILDYEVMETVDNKSLVKIKLKTGRTHQIRVQFASRKMPLLGDGKYGSREKCQIALFSHHLIIEYPKGSIIDKSFLPDFPPFTLFSL